MTQQKSTDWIVPGAWVVDPENGVGQVQGLIDHEGQSVARIHIGAVKGEVQVALGSERAGKLRPTSSDATVQKALRVLREKKEKLWRLGRNGPAIRPWQQKLLSGDLVIWASVLRDLYREKGEPRHSDAERNLYREVMTRFTAEMAAIKGRDPAHMRRVIDRMMSWPKNDVADSARAAIPEAPKERRYRKGEQAKTMAFFTCRA